MARSYKSWVGTSIVKPTKAPMYILFAVVLAVVDSKLDRDIYQSGVRAYSPSVATVTPVDFNQRLVHLVVVLLVIHLVYLC